MNTGIYDGKYFLFLLNSSEYNPTHVYFRDREIKLKHSHPEYRWREKYYLYPTILQKKWYEYKINERYIPSIRFDTTLPLLLDLPFLVQKDQKPIMSIASQDTNYKKLELYLKDKKGNIAWQKMIKSLWKDEKKSLEIDNLKPGLYKIYIRHNEDNFFKGCVYYLEEKNLVTMDFEDFKRIIKDTREGNKKLKEKIKIYCINCKSEVIPLKPHSITEYHYINYIPFKEYVDFERLSDEKVKEYLTNTKNPGKHRSGLIHLLNIIRMASLDDELKIIQSLFKDDPPFGYFITEKLFFFELIPLMKDRDLQSILTKIDDDIISSSLNGANTEVKNKILRNLSRRRIRYIQGKNITQENEKSEISRQFISKEIRNYCVKIYGRLIKIPVNRINSYRIFWDEDSLNRIKEIHGEKLLVLINGSPMIITGNTHKGECKVYNIEYSNDVPICITGITESSIIMCIKTPLRYLYLHIYYWATNLEDFKFYENLPKETIIPFNYSSPALIITAGGVDTRSRPIEQLIRIKTGQV